MRFGADHHLRREHRRHGHHPGVLGVGDRRRGGDLHLPGLCRQTLSAHPVHPHASDGRGLPAAVRGDRGLGRAHAGRVPGRLLPAGQPVAHRGGAHRRHQRRGGPTRFGAAQGHGPGHGGRHAAVAQLPPAGPTGIDQRAHRALSGSPTAGTHAWQHVTFDWKPVPFYGMKGRTSPRTGSSAG